ncbi:unnamed protein product [Effrenium voratum]|uniref:Uncharacterized protein n=1 Tax=Effrenium voratum TaxID=2562239 RepID=A0AA36J066_9DINO|nr:unnamed protein product [Effrenium voratum]
MAPGFGALPKHQGRLGPLAARHLLHGFFNSHYGLNIAGLGFHNSQQESDVEAVEDLALVKDRAPKLHLALAKEAPSVHGLSLRELAVYAAVLQRHRGGREGPHAVERPSGGTRMDLPGLA